MEKNIHLDDMSIEEKIQTMEDIWEDLIKNAEDIPSPKWHKDIIKDREQEYIKGNIKAIDWNEAKKTFKKNIE